MAGFRKRNLVKKTEKEPAENKAEGRKCMAIGVGRREGQRGR